MALLRALVLSQNGRPGTVFQADGHRAEQLTACGIAEEVTQDQLNAEAEAVEADPDGLDEFAETKAPENKGGKTVKKANKKAETKKK